MDNVENKLTTNEVLPKGTKTLEVFKQFFDGHGITTQNSEAVSDTKVLEEITKILILKNLADESGELTQDLAHDTFHAEVDTALHDMHYSWSSEQACTE